MGRIYGSSVALKNPGEGVKSEGRDTVSGPISAYLALRSILILCEQAKIAEDGVLAEYLQLKIMNITFRYHCL